MKALLVVPPRTGLFRDGRGGLEIQIEKTVAALVKAGVNVVPYDPWQNQVADADVCHVFSLDPSLAYHIEHAVNMRKPVVISPVFNNFHTSLNMTRLKLQLSGYVPGMYSDLKRAKKMLRDATAIVTLNTDELNFLSGVFGLAQGKGFIVPNGMDRRFSMASAAVFEQAYGVNNFVLQVGSIEHRKNQLNLIKAVKHLGVKLVIIGDATPANKNYLSRCQEEANGNIIFTGRIAHDSHLLRSAYAAAKVFALPSFSEVMPLSLYEAALAGCQIVVGWGIPVAESIKPYVATANPHRPSSIAKVIAEKLKSSGDPDLRRTVLNMPSWDGVGSRIKQIYECVLGGRTS